jgi:hypothetical protein
MVDREVSIAVDADLVTDICRLVRGRSSNPIEGLVALVGSIWMIKTMYLESLSDEGLATLVGNLMRDSPKVVRVQDPTHPLN